MTPPVSARVPAEPDTPTNYLDLYGLSKPPFGAASETAGYILFGSNRRAFELVVDHIVNGTGLVTLSGPEGVGKTEMLRAAAAVAAESGRQTIQISRPEGSRITLDQLVIALHGQPALGPVAIDEAIQNFKHPPRKVIIADDVELMPDDCVSLLLSLGHNEPDRPGAPALVMSSSIELTSDPARPDLAQLNSLARNTIRMNPLLPAEIRQYIERSLWIAGGTTRRLITADAMKLLIARAGGLPGTVNRLMEAAFTAGFARGDAMITAKTVTAAVGPAAPRPPPRAPVESSALAGLGLQIAAACLLVTGASVFIYKALTVPAETPTPALSSTPVAPARPPIAAKPEQLPPPKQAETLPPELIAALIKRGNEAFDLGDLSAARLLFQRAATAGNATAATALAKTYDPNFNSGPHARDPARAAEWYQKAITLGDPKAADLLKRLTQH